MNKVILQIVSCLVSCIMMVGCSDEIFNNESREGTGYLSIALGRVNVELSSISRAEAGTLPAELIPQEEDFEIDIQKDGISVDGFPKPYIEITDNIELTAGSYTVIAYSGENNDIQDKPYFSGSSSIQIYPGKSTEVNINTALGNAMLTPSVSESLQKHYSEWTLTLKVGEVSMKLADNANTGGSLFVKSDQSVNAVFEGKNILEKETSHEWEVVSSAAACTKYVIQCDPDLSVFSGIQLTAVSTHTYAENLLTGTDVILNINDNGAPLELVDSWNIKVLYNNTPIRTYTSKPENGVNMIVADGWPYVPQGSNLVANIHLITGEDIELESVVMEEIPQPEFSVTVVGSTSYSVYKNLGAEAANTKDGSSIFDINATANIASEILNNPNYSDLLKVIYTTDSGQNSGELSYGISTQFNSIAWQKHDLTATIRFDGIEKTSLPLECHVTGLPYMPSAMVETDWEFSSWNCKYDNGIIQLGGVSGSGSCTATFNIKFYLPENVEVMFNTDVTIRASKIIWWQNTTFTVNVNGKTVISQYSNNEDNNNTGKRYSLSGVSTFSPDAYEVKLNSSYEAAGPWSKVHSLHILYN